MSTRLILGMVAGATVLLAPLAASAEPVPPACVVVVVDQVQLQAGYAPNGPADCTSLPPARR